MIVFFIITFFTIWTASSEFGTYRLCEQRRFRQACASAQSRQNLRCSLIQAMSQEEPSDRKPDPWACAVKICQDGMLEDTNSLDGAHMVINNLLIYLVFYCQCFQTHNQGTVINVLFLTSENEILGIIYSLFRGRQNIFLTIFSIKLDVKCATKFLKIGWQIYTKVMSISIFEHNFF